MSRPNHYHVLHGRRAVFPAQGNLPVLTLAKAKGISRDLAHKYKEDGFSVLGGAKHWHYQIGEFIFIQIMACSAENCK